MSGWTEIYNFVSVFEEQAIKISRREMGDTARAFSKKVREIIRGQQYNLKPLSKSYLEYKKRTGLDPRILIATKTYVDKIRAKPIRKKGKIVSYTVGPPDGIHEPSGLPYRTLARIHEFGSRDKRIPARPVWRPAWSAFVRKDAKEAVKRVGREALKKARKKAFRK